MNTKRVVVVASDDAPGSGDTDASGMEEGAETGSNKAYRKVVVRITNVDESGRLTLSDQQPQSGTDTSDAALTLDATLADDDATAAQITNAVWKWERASSIDGEWTVIVGASATTSSYAPSAGVVGKYLRVTATYTDSYGSGKTAMAVSAHVVKEAPSTNTQPAAKTGVTRSIAENSPAGTAVGDPVTTTDPNNDILTYTIADNDNFSIDPGHGSDHGEKPEPR